MAIPQNAGQLLTIFSITQCKVVLLLWLTFHLFSIVVGKLVW